MTKSRTIPFWIWLIIGLIGGVTLTLCRTAVLQKAERDERLRACLQTDFSSFDLTKAQYTETDKQLGTTYRTGDWQVIRQGDPGEEVILLTDSWTGQMRQYNRGVLFAVYIAEYGKGVGPDYRHYQIRSPSDCDLLADLLEKNRLDEIKEQGGSIWQMASGETFID